MGTGTVDAFETARLAAERLTVEHLPELLRMHTDPKVMATLGGLRDRAITMLYLERNLAHWNDHGFGSWILRDQARGSFSGRAALRHLLIEGIDEVELGYAFHPEWWGRGLATEIARTCVQIGREKLELPSIVAVSQPDHAASQQVMRNAGLMYERLVMHGGTPHVLYRTPPD